MTSFTCCYYCGTLLVLQQWPGYCCPLGFACVGNDKFYYNCQKQMGNGGPPSYTPAPAMQAKKCGGEMPSIQLSHLALRSFFEVLQTLRAIKMVVSHCNAKNCAQLCCDTTIDSCQIL